MHTNATDEAIEIAALDLLRRAATGEVGSRALALAFADLRNRARSLASALIEGGVLAGQVYDG